MKRQELNDLAAFSAVAKARSFTRAAAELGVSASALSHTMRTLEERLGVRLLARTTRSVSPTGAGERLIRSLGPAFDEIDAGLAALSAWRRQPAGVVRLTTFSYAARTVLEPALPLFILDHPDIQVEVSVDDRPIDIVAAGFDAGIRIGESVEKDMVAIRVGPDLRTMVVATPDYFARHPPPEAPADLARHACIGYRLKGSGGLLQWEFERDGREVNFKVAGPLIVNDSALATAAIRAGVGVGYMMEEDAAKDIAEGRLVQVLQEWSPRFPGCHLYHPSRRQVPPALRALIDALRMSLHPAAAP